MPVDRRDPYRNSRFLVEIDGIIQAGFSEITVPDSTSDIVEYREGKDSPTMRKLLGLTKFGNITLKWGVTDSLELYEKWRKPVEEGNMKAARKSVAIILMSEDGSPAARWEFENAWPIKYDAPDMSAKGNEVAIETLEIAHESMKRVKV